MKYKLLKDTPTIKAGTIFEEVASDFNQWKELVRITPIGAKTSPQFTIQDIDNFDEWFEEIQEPTDSIHWKPKYDDWYFYISDHGSVCSDIWNDNYTDNNRLAFGFVYRTEKEAQKAREHRLAEVRLQGTSDFKPDFENGNGGYIVDYDYINKKLECCDCFWNDSGEIVRYETKEDAEKSIEENREDWLIYFGIKEEE
nr:MAG TPA: hypothetical protein [Caudoviricetes sp.]